MKQSGLRPRPELEKAGQMGEQTTTLSNDGGHEDANPAQSDLERTSLIKPRVRAMKFTHASGSRPLEGYTIKRGIGIGGFGEVYFAISDSGKEVALKHIQRNLDVELRGVSQCLNLKHPNLVAIYDIRYDDHGDGWVVMEFVSGESLKDTVDSHLRGMPLDLVRSWFTGIAAGTAYLHDHGIVHRDLKPGNIFLDEDLVKIGDYGLSKFISVSRRSGQTESVGTFHYMAPEIGKGIYGKEIDVYALGVILCEMLMGKVPFDGESSQEIIMKHLTDEPDLNGLPPVYSKVVAKSLAKDPANRYSNVLDMLADLNLDVETTKPVAASTNETLACDAQTHKKVENTIYITDDVDVSDIVLGPVHDTSRPASGEPIADAVCCGWQRTHAWWKNSRIHTSIKVLIAVAAILFSLGNLSWLFPLAAMGALVYLGYLGIRAMVLERPVTAPAASTAMHSEPLPVQQVKRRNLYRGWHVNGREQLRLKPARTKTTEVAGSMLMGAIVVAVLSLVAMIVDNQDFTGNVLSWGPLYAWLTLSGIAGTWTVLIGTKHWEGFKEDAALRRFAMLMMGLIVGAISFGLSDLLLVEPEHLAVSATGYSDRFYSTIHHTPEFLAYLGYFAGLFVVTRLWKQTDPLRNSRLSRLGTGAFVVWAVVLSSFLPFRHGWMLAAIMSIAIQLAAPWMETAERSRIRNDVRQMSV